MQAWHSQLGAHRNMDWLHRAPLRALQSVRTLSVALEVLGKVRASIKQHAERHILTMTVLTPLGRRAEVLRRFKDTDGVVRCDIAYLPRQIINGLVDGCTMPERVLKPVSDTPK